MGHTYDATGIDLKAGNFELLPDGEYTLKIKKATDHKSAKGHLYAKLECEVINNPEHNGRRVFHNVTFLPPTTEGKPTKGAGMAIHFLKTIGEPWEGKIDIDIPHWEGASFNAKIGKTTYTNKDGKTVEKNEIKAVDVDPNYVPF